MIIFCDATSVLIELAADIEKKIRQPVGHYHGRVSEDQRERSKGQFKSGELSVLLCSSAGERGINLPEASYVINYDVPMSHSSYIQRVNRASRIGTNTDGILVATTYVANGTVENGALNVWNRRNSDSDRLIDRDALISDDLSFMSAANRKEIYRIARKLHKETAA